MAKSKQEKKKILENYKESIAASKSIVVLKTTGVTPVEATKLRSQLFEAGAKYSLIKNTLFKIALKDSKFEEELDLNDLEHSVLFMKEDFVSPSKALKAFIKDTTSKAGDAKIEIVSGYIDGVKISKEQVEELAEMPTKEGSISLILGILDQAIGGVANVLQNPVQSYLSVIDQAFKA